MYATQLLMSSSVNHLLSMAARDDRSDVAPGRRAGESTDRAAMATSPLAGRVYPTKAVGEKARLFVLNNGESDVKVTHLNAYEMRSAKITSDTTEPTSRWDPPGHADLM
ncbi:beta-fructofuranosidase, insoluble isoenzyme 3-like [Panicum miliaceum]|uniref:Beta-fructofuranosidase, insoluble isoenzyme 3-like n=1 Tax=Panicum miliaceum TaxID=4540 RepID=A0A3L6SIM2_PANMI|nr:beta-fructofuranosidase, insoluble isoenzyme 3-like [Panicum miliaceum]